jgi:hypothetical protein
MQPCLPVALSGDRHTRFVVRIFTLSLWLAGIVSGVVAMETTPSTLHVFGTLRSELEDGDGLREQPFEIELGSTFTGFTLFRPDSGSAKRLLFADGQYLIKQHGRNGLLMVYPPALSIAAGESKRLRLLLLAFGSRFSGPSQNNLPPPALWPLHEEAPEIRAAARPMDGWPWLPESARYFSDGWQSPTQVVFHPLLVLAPDVPRVRVAPPGKVKKHQRPFDTGFGEVVYEVQARAEISGTLLPTRAQLRVLRPYLNAELKKTLVDRYRYTLDVEQVEFVPGTNSWLSRMPDGTNVAEHRTTQGRFYANGTCYPLTNGTLLPWEEIERRRKLRAGKTLADLARAAEKADASSGTASATLENPTLARIRASDSIRFAWPRGVAGHSLYTTTNLTPPANWIRLTNGVTLSNDQWKIDVPVTKTGARFFRLQSP